MNISKPPPGFTLHLRPCESSWLRPAWAQRITRAIEASTKPVIEIARASAQSRSFRGRGAVASWKSPAFDQQLVVRRCSHGGLWRYFAGDRYPNERRARIEIQNSDLIRQLGISTPEIVGVVFYKSSIFLRMDFITVYVDNSEDLVEFLSRQPSPPQREQAFAAVRALLEQCASSGLRHKDLNARNILVANQGASMRAYVLDVEDVAWSPDQIARTRSANQARLARSLRKRVRHGDIPMTQEQISIVISGLESRA